MKLLHSLAMAQATCKESMARSEVYFARKVADICATFK